MSGQRRRSTDAATPIDDTPPDDPGAPATLDWVVAFLDTHVVAIEPETESAAMAIAYALGFAGAARIQVWWVLREERLRIAIASILATAQRLRQTEPPEWAGRIATQAPATRRAIAMEAAEQARENASLVNADRAALFAACAAHPDAAWSSDGDSLALPYGVLEEVAEVARSIGPADIARLIEAAREPVARRLHEAALVYAEEGMSFHVPPTGDHQAA